MVTPAWMTPEQRAAYQAGIDRANTPVPVGARDDRRIALDDVVSYACPAHLTDDYDPTYRARVR